MRDAAQVIQVAGIVSVDHVNRQAELGDRVQGGGRNQIAAMQHHLGAEAFCLGDGGGQQAAVVVRVGDEADFHVAEIVPKF